MATLVVDDNLACGGASFADIQSAVTAAAPGDTIQVCPGTYLVPGTINLNKAGLTILGTGAARPVIQIPTSTGYGFNVSASNVTLDNLEIQKADLGSPHNMIYVGANNFTAQNNLIYGPNPGSAWSVNGIVSRAFEVTGGLSGLLIQNNTIHTLRQPAYINGGSPRTTGSILNNNVSGTRGWVIDGATINFNGNTFGPPANQGADIALLSSVNPADYPDLAALSANNDNAVISAQFAGGTSGSATTYVDDSAPAGGIGTADAPFQTIQQAVNATYNGGTINVAAGSYPEYVTTNKNLTFLGPQAGIDARVGRTDLSAEAVVGTTDGAFNLQVNPGTTKIDGFRMSGASSSNGDRPALLLIGGSGHQIINNIIEGNQRGAFLSTSDTTLKRNRLNNSLDGFFGGGTNTTVEENLFTGGHPSGAVNTTNGTQSNNYKIINNVATAGGNFAVVFNTNNGQVTGNTVTNASASAIFIGGGNNNLLVANNSVTNGTSTAVSLSGGFGYPADSNITIKSNTLNNNVRGINVGTGANTTTGIEAHFNRIVGNSVMGINNVSTSSVNAENNWWGCNYGPGATGAGCSGTTNGIAGIVDANPWLILTTSANPNTVITGATSNITSKLTINSNNVDTSAAGTVPNGTPATFAATLGTVSPTSSTTTSGVTGTTFTAGMAVGTGGVQTTIDGQTANAPISVIYTCNNVSIPTGTTVATNTQFLVPINVDSTTGRNILAYDFTLTYNPAVITPIGIETAGTLSNGWTITTNNSSGTLVVSGFNTSPLSGAGTLLNIRFISTGGIGTNSTLNLTSFRFNEGVPCVNVTNGNVTIIAGTISGRVTYANAAMSTPVPNTTLNASGSIPVSGSTDANGDYSLSGFGAGPYTVTPSKTGQVNGISNADATAVAQHVVGFITLNSTQQMAADVSGNGTITSLDASYIAQYVAGFSNPSSTGTWKFNPVNRSYPNVQTSYTNQDYSAILMGEVTGNWNPAMAFAGSLELSDKKQTARKEDDKQVDSAQPEQVVTVTAPLPQIVGAGTNFTVNLQSSNTTGEGVFGYEFNLLYDANIVIPQAATPCDGTGTISAGRSIVCNPNTPGLLRVVVFSTTGTPISGSGVLLKVNFTAVGAQGALSPLTFQNFMFNEGTPQDVTVDGAVQILGPTAANASIDGRVVSASGRVIPRARITITGTDGEVRATNSNQFGRFSFDNLKVGETYVISAASKGFSFTPQAVSVIENLKELALIADQ